MLDNTTLSQLKQLKQQIEDSKEYAEGIVKGTQRKFGFVVLEDGREIFLSPDEMQKVFPDEPPPEICHALLLWVPGETLNMTLSP